MSRNQEFAEGHPDAPKSEPIKAVRFGEPVSKPSSTGYTHDKQEFLVSQGNGALYEGVHGILAGPQSIVSNRYNEENWYEPDDGPNGQMALFDADYYPPRIATLFATKGARHLVPTALGLMAQHSKERYGSLPEADSDLSHHSARLVAHLQKAGVLGGETPAATNDSGFKDSNYDLAAANMDANLSDHKVEYSPEDISKSQKFVRDLLRPKRHEALSPSQFPPQMEQGTLF